MSIEAEKFREAAARADQERNAATTHPAGIQCVEDLSYGPHGVWNRLNLYVPEGTDGLLPVIVSVHGGGYVYGTKEVYHHYCADLASRGFVVVNINFRLAPDHRFPSQLEDINNLFWWLWGQRGMYHMDLERLFVVGDSAGAQLASQYGAILTNGTYAMLFSWELPPVKIRALGLNCGTYDLYAKIISPVFKLGRDYLDESFDLADPRLDVLGAVTGDYPPSHITTSCYDFNLPGAKPFEALLHSKGVRAVCECYGTPEQKELGHVFHVDIRLPEAKACNDAQCAFFREQLGSNAGDS